MELLFSTITWGMERGIDLGIITLRWYSLLFALGFVLGYRLMLNIFKKEGIARDKLDSMLTYTVIATVIGARLGHVFFYEWSYYKDHIGEIFKVWEGGLASHGAAIALIIAMYYYGKRVVKRSTLWSLDRLVITVALAGCFIRLGNWMNSEIYGGIENSAIETVFTQPTLRWATVNYGNFFTDAEMKATGTIRETDSVNYPVYQLHLQTVSGMSDVQAQQAFTGLTRSLNSRSTDERNVIIEPNAELAPNAKGESWYSAEVLGIPRWPTQLIEALGYLLIFFILYKVFNTSDFRKREGFVFGSFLVLIFGFRFVIEFWKANQTAFEVGMALNMGQWLSIPLVLTGLFFILRAKAQAEGKAG